MKLSDNLTLAEAIKSNTAIRKGIDNSPTKEHLHNMELVALNIFEPIRDHFMTPLYVSSMYRSESLNKAVKGSKTSQHCKGEAIDIDMNGSVTNKMVFDYIKNNLIFSQLIWEFGTKENPDWLHVSYSDKNRNQVLRAKKVNGKTIYEKF